jgi:hypothetical protein
MVRKWAICRAVGGVPIGTGKAAVDGRSCGQRAPRLARSTYFRLNLGWQRFRHADDCAGRADVPEHEADTLGGKGICYPSCPSYLKSNSGGKTITTRAAQTPYAGR